MKKKEFSFLVFIFLTLIIGQSFAATKDISIKTFTNLDHIPSFPGIHHYPVPDADFTQHIVRVKPNRNESNYRIHIQIGKWQLADCNTYFYAKKIDSRLQQGADLYFVLESLGQRFAYSSMPCFTNDTEQFVPFVHELYLPYNSEIGRASCRERVYVLV